jgi:CheY-like chemotaxis protein
MAHSRKKILLIEDDHETAALVVEELVDRGFAASVVEDGKDGLLAILKEKPDMVLCDVSLPRMSGFEVLERLNDIGPRFGGIPFVATSAIVLRWASDQRRTGA